MDCGSCLVHGTWVSGKRIEAGARVEMREGDTLSVGGSSRVYKLHWVPLRDAYDFECPKEKKEEELAIIEEKAVEDCEVMSACKVFVKMFLGTSNI